MRTRKRQLLVCAGMLCALLLTACGANLHASGIVQARSLVAAEVQHARAIGVPAATLARFTAQEQQIDNAQGWFGISSAVAITRYQQLLAQVQQGESDATATSQNAASTDLSDLAVAVERGISAQVVPVAFRARWQQWQSALSSASSPADYDALDRQIRADLQTVNAMTTTHDTLQQFQTTVASLHQAGLPVALEEAELAQAQTSYAQATTTADFDRLNALLEADQVGLVANETQAIPYLGSALLTDLQTRIAQAQGFGESVAPYQSALTSDQVALTQAHSLVDYLDLKNQVNAQEGQLNVMLVRDQAKQDLDQLRALTAYCQQHNIMDYEYTADTGLQSAASDFAASTTAADYQQVDDEITMLLLNLRAMVANLADATPYNQPHATDLSLSQSYGVTTGKVIIVSLREQTLRAYDNGQLIYAIYITSGRPELPTPPGLWHVLQKVSPIIFTSGAPKGSPDWYAPTPVHEALLFHDGGYYLHDAWWRVKFGPGSNLPHYDPEAFNGGSHGCVNLPLQPMGLLYNWADVGTPVIVY